MTEPGPACQAAFDDWWANVILPDGTRVDVAHEVFCAGWDAGAARERASRIVSAAFACRSEDCPQPFALYRAQDVTGVSGSGTVAHGAQFADGTVVLRWRGESPSTVIWDSLDTAVKVHGHDGKTRVVWLAAEFSEMGKAEQEAAAAERERCIAEIFAYANDVLTGPVAAAYRDAARLLLRGRG